jgi:hypothetical protein
LEESVSQSKVQLVLYNLAVGLPLVTLLSLIFVTGGTYYALYLVPLIFGHDQDLEVYYWQTDEEREHARIRGLILAVLVTWSLFWLLTSLYRAVRTSPGNIPETSEWQITGEEAVEDSLLIIQETAQERRKGGTLRTCSRCLRRKPDRVHHCRLCDRCVLKMDHHCPWILNCVGYFNYKFFFFLFAYSALSLAIIVSSLWETVVVTLSNPDSPTFESFAIVMVYSL